MRKPFVAVPIGSDSNLPVLEASVEIFSEPGRRFDAKLTSLGPIARDAALLKRRQA